MSFNQITFEALQLTSRERAILAETIWESIEDPYLSPMTFLIQKQFYWQKKRFEN